MKTLFYFIAICPLFANGLTSVAGDEFSATATQQEIILKAGGKTFTISKNDSEECIKIDGKGGITPVYRYKADKKTVFLKGVSLKESRPAKEEGGRKTVELVFQEEENFKLELSLSVEKGLPILFVKASLKNAGSSPQGEVSFEWFDNRKFDGYIGQNMQKREMPATTGTDYTLGMASKTGWSTIGTSRKDRWVYLLRGNNSDETLGIIIQGAISEHGGFGIREDRFVYWAEMIGALEEGSALVSSFALVPGKSFDDFKNILSQRDFSK